MATKPLALIVGVGDGLSSSLARLFHSQGYRLALAARNVEKLTGLVDSMDATAYRCDAAKRQDVELLFSQLDKKDLEVCIYNPSLEVRAPIDIIDPKEVKKSIDVNVFGSFLFGQQSAKAFIEKGGGGTILFTGASAGRKGLAQYCAFSMGKFAQRGLAQSMARELHPKNIHVCWINIDGPIRVPGRVEKVPDSMLDPDAITQTYLSIVKQHRSAWTDEISLHSWAEQY